MSILLSYDDVKKQSQGVWNQFGERWQEFSRLNSRLPNRRDCHELRNCGLGRFAVMAAMGESLVEAAPVLKKYRDRFDLVTCDKGFPALMEQGIKPDFVQICDTNIPYRWLEPWVKETGGVKLLATSYANIEWTHRWKGPIYFYVNKDALDTQKKFLDILGNPVENKHAGLEQEIKANSESKIRVIPAGSNVSNALLTFFIGMDEGSQVNWSGYEHFFLTGYDYSWRPSGESKCRTGTYYAFDDPTPKRHYMNHRTMLDINGDIVNTSDNLLFSAKWLYSYVSAYNLPVTNCSGRGILDIKFKVPLDKALEKISKDPNSRAEFIEAVTDHMTLLRSLDSVSGRMQRKRRALWSY